MKIPFKVDLSNEVAVVTGAGGVLCSGFAAALAACGAKVAVCDLRLDAAEAAAEAIRAEGGVAKAYEMNVLKKDSIEACRDAIKADFGAVCTVGENGELMIQLRNADEKKAVMSRLAEKYDIDEVKVFEPSLNDIFVEYAGDAPKED